MFWQNGFDSKEISFTRIKPIYEKILKAFGGGQVHEVSLHQPCDGTQKVVLFYRRLWDVVKELLQDQGFQGKFTFRPKPLYDKNGNRMVGPFSGGINSCIYVVCAYTTEIALLVGLWWEAIQEIAGADATVACILLYSDETRIFSHLTAYPVYVALGNFVESHRFLNKSIRLVSLLPLVKESHGLYSSSFPFPRRKHQIWHSSVNLFMAGIEELSEQGMLLICLYKTYFWYIPYEQVCGFQGNLWN